MAKDKIRGQDFGRLGPINRGGIPDMISPYNQMPIKGDVHPGDTVPGPQPRDPLGYFPKDNPAKGR